MAVIAFSRLIGPIPISVVMREVHDTSIGVSELPVETGAKITDHAYVEPKRLTLEFADDNPVATFNALVRFQESRVPFSLVSGLFVYNNMIIKNLNVTRDATYSTVLYGRAELQEVIIVSTTYTSAEADGDTDLKGGNAGGKNSIKSARPTTERAGDAVTGDRAAGTVMRGDAATKTVPTSHNASIASRLF